ncbi:MAG: efflux RND transporter periplasmic adaptor subunit [Mariniblastus sp.]|nr:efflux RND transporter periplasmic adaptor subunit [Mariniblastus sp.]
MKLIWKFVIGIAILAGIGAAIYPSAAKAIAERNKPRWRTMEVDAGTITKTVNATGTVKPTKSVQVGSFVSGPITDLYVEFNQEVKQNEILARIDPRLFEASYARDLATLSARKADLVRIEALHQQAVNDEARALKLRAKNVDFIAQSELDQVRFNRISLSAQLDAANAAIEQATASLTNSKTNLEYCEIKSPEDGMIVDRKVEPGQTLAAQFQTPELFVVGVGMRKKMHIFADVDESEIGLIRKAAKEQQPVSFTVTAYPDDLFSGLIEEVRYSSSETQNVVTYPVVVGSPNPDLKLLPGMTADLSFQVMKIENVVRIPKAALWFYPPDKKFVHEDFHTILDGVQDDYSAAEDEVQKETTSTERVEANRKAKKRHVWFVKDDLLHAIEVKTGLKDTRYAELVDGELETGMQLVTGQKAKGEK